MRGHVTRIAGNRDFEAFWNKINFTSKNEGVFPNDLLMVIPDFFPGCSQHNQCDADGHLLLSNQSKMVCQSSF